MKQTLQVIGLSFMVVGIALAMVGLIVIGNTLPSQRTYDCSMAEFHPDYPLQVREECRKLRLSKSV
jgi:hypothetical protein